MRRRRFSSKGSGEADAGSDASQGSGGEGGNSSGGGTSAGGTSAGGGGGGGGTSSTGGTTGAGGVTGNGGASATGGAAVVDASPPRWCDGRDALYCEDFDRYTDLNSLFDAVTTYSVLGAEFSLDTGTGMPSPPNVFRVRTTVTKDVRSLIYKELAPFSKQVSKIRLEFSMRIDKAANVGFLSGAAFAAIVTGADITDGVVALQIGQGPTLAVGYLEAQSAGTGFGSQNASGPFPTLNQWAARYALEIEYSDGDSGRTGCAQLLVGGIPQLNDCLVLPPSLVDPAFVSVGLGVYSSGLGNSGEVELRFDNVLLTAQ